MNNDLNTLNADDLDPDCGYYGQNQVPFDVVLRYIAYKQQEKERNTEQN